MKLGAIEAGGTKFVVCVGDEFGNVIERDSLQIEFSNSQIEYT